MLETSKYPLPTLTPEQYDLLVQSILDDQGHGLEDLGGLVEFERKLPRDRAGEGRNLAKARGLKISRKPKFIPTGSMRACSAKAPARALHP